MNHICISAKRDCYALAYSYGEICCHTNCCGRFGIGIPMYEARLQYHKVLLKANKEFDNWIKGAEELQRKNVLLNIAYERRKIKDISKKIEQLKRQQKGE